MDVVPVRVAFQARTLERKIGAGLDDPDRGCRVGALQSLFDVALQLIESRRYFLRQKQIVRDPRNLLGFLPRVLEKI